MSTRPNPKRERGNATRVPRSRFLKLRCFGFPPQRGSPKSARGKRSTRAPPWVPNVTEFKALKGRPNVGHIKSVAPSGLEIIGKPPTQGVALGWQNIAPLGLKSKNAQLQNAQAKGNVNPSFGQSVLRLRVRLQYQRKKSDYVASCSVGMCISWRKREGWLSRRLPHFMRVSAWLIVR